MNQKYITQLFTHLTLIYMIRTLHNFGRGPLFREFEVSIETEKKIGGTWLKKVGFLTENLPILI